MTNVTDEDRKSATEYANEHFTELCYEEHEEAAVFIASLYYAYLAACSEKNRRIKAQQEWINILQHTIDGAAEEIKELDSLREKLAQAEVNKAIVTNENALAALEGK